MCCNCTVTHGLGCVHSITPDLFICSPCDNDACLLATPPPPSQPFWVLFKAIVFMPVRCPYVSTRPAVHHGLIGGNAFVLWSDWASATIAAVLTRVGRCYRSRFGGAILLTRSLLRQAASNTARSGDVWFHARPVYVRHLVICLPLSSLLVLKITQ